MTALIPSLRDRCTQFENASRALGRGVSIEPFDLLQRDATLNLQPPGMWSANRQCVLAPALDGWLAISLPRDDDVRSVPAWTGCALDDDPWEAVLSYIARTPCDVALAGAIMLHLPVAQLGEQRAQKCASLLTCTRRGDRAMTALDLSALWAGPLCGGLLAAAGVHVTRVESPARPDPTIRTAPELHQRLNGQKKLCSFALDDPGLMASVATTDILITSGRAHALARHGITEEALLAINPALIWVAITAHGWRGAGAMRTGFGDDCAAAGGLVRWAGDRPYFIGDALADPLTGLEAALAVARAVDAGQAGLIDIALAPTAARYAHYIGLE